jgi:hypothetical protein
MNLFHPCRPEKMNLDIPALLCLMIKQVEENHLGDPTWILTKGPTLINLLINPPPSALLYMMNESLITEYIVSYFLKPCMLR